MTKEQRLAFLDKLVRAQSWSLSEEVIRCVGEADALDSEQKVEWILVLAHDIAGIRGEPVSVAQLEAMLKPPEPPAKTYPEDVSDVIEAIEMGLVSELRRAIQAPGADLEEISEYHDHMTPLLLALYQRDTAMVKVLIDAGANVHYRGGYPDAPIHLACLAGPRILQLVIDAGADLNCRSGSGETPLTLLAARDKHLDAVNVLLRSGAERRLPNGKGETPLAIAEREGAHALATALTASRP